MKVIVQRVSQASVEVNNEIVGSIDKGYLLFVCFEAGDTSIIVDKAIDKIINLRIWEEEGSDKMNLNLSQVGGEILSISQFTLSWDGKKGHRPSFTNSMEPTSANQFYKEFNSKLRMKRVVVKEGIFAGDMKVSIINDGPVTFQLNFQ
jgi:D-tyrosyl-tRNA(Tyr) deacylase